MSEYQLEIKQIVDYPRCRIYRQFITMLLQDKDIRVGGSAHLFYYAVLCNYANFRTSYKRIDGISYIIYPGEWLCRVSELAEWFRTHFQHQALAILQDLQNRHLIAYSLLGRGKLIKFKIMGWHKHNRVLDYNAPCAKDTGFFFLPVSVATELVSQGRCSEMDALLDLWINTVYNDEQVQGSDVGPVVYLRNGTGNPLLGYAELAQRWGVAEAKSLCNFIKALFIKDTGQKNTAFFFFDGMQRGVQFGIICTGFYVIFFLYAYTPDLVRDTFSPAASVYPAQIGFSVVAKRCAQKSRKLVLQYIVIG